MLVCVATLAALAAACRSDDHPAEPSRLPTVAWKGEVPLELRSTPVAPAPRCRASQLRARGAGVVFRATDTGGTGEATLENRGPGACSLSGRPSVRFVGGSPGVRQRQVALPPRQLSFPALAPPASALLALRPGRAARVVIDWRNWCVPVRERADARPAPPRALRLTLPGGEDLDLSYNAVVRCDSPREPSTIGVGPFQPAPLPTTRAWTSVPLRARIQTLNGETARLTGRRGSVLGFSVEVRNTTTDTARPARCPLVYQLLAPAGKPEAHLLNCAAELTIAPGDAIRLEMRIRIPDDAPTGANGLFWVLDPLGAQGPEAFSRVIVSP